MRWTSKLERVEAQTKKTINKQKQWNYQRSQCRRTLKNTHTSEQKHIKLCNDSGMHLHSGPWAGVAFRCIRYTYKTALTGQRNNSPCQWVKWLPVSRAHTVWHSFLFSLPIFYGSPVYIIYIAVFSCPCPLLPLVGFFISLFVLGKYVFVMLSVGEDVWSLECARACVFGWHSKDPSWIGSGDGNGRDHGDSLSLEPMANGSGVNKPLGAKEITQSERMR